MPRKKKNDIDSILESVNRTSLKDNYFFMTTLDRYILQINIIDKLKETLEKDGAFVTKEYVKGRENVYTHPAVSEINKATVTANGTMATLLNIMKTVPEDEGKSKLEEMLNGMKDD